MIFTRQGGPRRSTADQGEARRIGGDVQYATVRCLPGLCHPLRSLAYSMGKEEMSRTGDTVDKNINTLETGGLTCTEAQDLILDALYLYREAGSDRSIFFVDAHSKPKDVAGTLLSSRYSRGASRCQCQIYNNNNL